MHATRRLQEVTRDSSLLKPKPDYSVEGPRPKTSMGPPPPVNVPRALQPSALHKNSNLYRPLKDLSPLLQRDTHKTAKVSHTGTKVTRTPVQPVATEVSLTSILKRSRNFDSATESGRESAREQKRESQPRYKRRKVQILNPLFEEYKDTIESSKVTLEKEGRTALNSAFKDLAASVKELAIQKEEELDTIENQLASVLGTLDEVKLPDGRIINVDAELQTFKSLVDTEQKFLAEKWADWDRLQEDIATLAVQVVGDEAKHLVPEDLFRRVPKEGYKTESEKWMKELEEELSGPLEELKAAGEEALKKMAAAEKESDKKFNEQKVKLIALITEEDNEEMDKL